MSLMRTLSSSSRSSFLDDPELQHYFLDEVRPTGKSLGHGSYGSVVEVQHQRTICAAKQIHEILLDSNNHGVQDIVLKYRQECQLMASIRHPNVTQFLGLCFVEDARLPLLVMEKLEMNLDDLLELAPILAISIKLSVLHDTCSGLVYLHSRQPPIVHRDLTSRNILITSSMSAKITDFGCSRMIDLQPGQVVKTMTKHPGTLVYMPPEALDERHRYGPSLDVFSFGHLTLYTIIQEFPGQLLSSTYPDPNNSERTIARSELERRQPYMATLETQIAQSYPTLLELVKQCLHMVPEKRPSSVDMLKGLEGLKRETNGAYGDITRQLDIGRIIISNKLNEIQVTQEQLAAENEALLTDLKKATEKQQIATEKLQQPSTNNPQISTDKQKLTEEKQQLLTEKCQLLTENHQLIAEKNKLLIEKQTLKEKYRTSLEKCARLQKVRNELEAQTDQLKLQTCHLERQRNTEKSKKAQIQNAKQMLQSEKNEIETKKRQLETEVDILRRQLESSNKQLEEKEWQLQQGTVKEDFLQVTFPLQLNWKCGPDMPFAMSEYIQSVEVKGTVYVGGGWTPNKEHRYIVMAYKAQFYQWYTLPPYSAETFALTSIHNKLVAVGGRDSSGAGVDKLGMWQSDSNQWSFPFPPMTTPRWGSSVVFFKHWLLVAGGYHHTTLSSVEILDVDSKQWSAGPSTPMPWHEMKSTIIGDTWYLTGGECNDKSTTDVYSAKLSFHFLKSKQKVWSKIDGHCDLSSPLNIGGNLLMAGGRDSRGSMCTIRRYIPETNEWVVTGELPCALFNCTFLVISNRLYVFGGHNRKQNSSSMYYSNM